MPGRSSSSARGTHEAATQGSVFLTAPHGDFPMTTEARRKAHQLGHVAEWRAVWRLRLAGYSVLARRYKTKLGEIDIVARRGGVLAFIEVKARVDAATAAF